VVPRKQYSLNPDAPSFQMNADGTYSVIPPMNQRRMSNKPVFYSTEGPQYMGVPTRRVSNFNNNLTGFETASAGLKLPPNVLRMPKGPDSGKGFSNWCRQRMGEPKRVSKAIPIVAPPQNIVTLSESLENSEASDASTSSSPLQIPDIQVEAASSGSEGSEDEAVVPDKSDSCDSGHEEDSCSDPEVQEFEIDTNERTR